MPGEFRSGLDAYVQDENSRLDVMRPCSYVKEILLSV